MYITVCVCVLQYEDSIKECHMDCFFSLLDFHVDADIMLCHTTVCGCTFFPQIPLLYSDYTPPPTRLFLSYFDTGDAKEEVYRGII